MMNFEQQNKADPMQQQIDMLSERVRRLEEQPQASGKTDRLKFGMVVSLLVIVLGMFTGITIILIQHVF